MSYVNQYVTEVLKTESVLPGFVYDTRSLHAIIGINTEAVELLDNTIHDHINYIEEIGDIFWYIALFCDSHNINFSEFIFDAESKVENFILDLNQLTKDYIVKKIVLLSSSLLDVMKKNIYYDKYRNNQINEIKFIEPIIQWVLILINKLDLELDKILIKNIAKLNTRYKDKKFNVDDAYTRDLEAEKLALING